MGKVPWAHSVRICLLGQKIHQWKVWYLHGVRQTITCHIRELDFWSRYTNMRASMDDPKPCHNHTPSPPLNTPGVNEDGQLGLDREQNNLMHPKVVESLLGIQFKGRGHLSAPLVGGSRNTLAIDADGEVRD